MPDVSLPLLSQIQIASPCPAKWDEMTGDAVTRLCAQCEHDVHNLSAMTSDEAESFLRARVGAERTCVRIFRRTDGTILTQDCPVGIALWRKRARFAAGRAAAALLFLVTGGFIASARQRDALAGRLRSAEPFRTVCAWFNPQAPTPPPAMMPGAWFDGLMSCSSFSPSANSSPFTATPNIPTSPTPSPEPTPLDAPQ